MTYSNWPGNRPDDYKPDHQNCAVLYYPRLTWDDSHCILAKYPVLCQKGKICMLDNKQPL